MSRPGCVVVGPAPARLNARRAPVERSWPNILCGEQAETVRLFKKVLNDRPVCLYAAAMTQITSEDVERVAAGYDPDPARSWSLRADAYTDPKFAEFEERAVFARTWQWVCHTEKLREPGSYFSATVAGMPIAIVRGRDGELRAFYNVCKHRAHELLSGSGTTRNIVCPYHAWTYSLDGSLKAARRADKMESFDKSEVCLDRVRV